VVPFLVNSIVGLAGRSIISSIPHPREHLKFFCFYIVRDFAKINITLPWTLSLAMFVPNINWNYGIPKIINQNPVIGRDFPLMAQMPFFYTTVPYSDFF